MVITVSGFSGYLSPHSDAESVEMAQTLVEQGYSVKINALDVRVNYGPGYNSLIWGEGDYAGQNVHFDTIPDMPGTPPPGNDNSDIAD